MLTATIALRDDGPVSYAHFGFGVTFERGRPHTTSNQALIAWAAGRPSEFVVALNDVASQSTYETSTSNAAPESVEPAQDTFAVPAPKPKKRK